MFAIAADEVSLAMAGQQRVIVGVNSHVHASAEVKDTNHAANGEQTPGDQFHLSAAATNFLVIPQLMRVLATTTTDAAIKLPDAENKQPLNTGTFSQGFIYIDDKSFRTVTAAYADATAKFHDFSLAKLQEVAGPDVKLGFGAVEGSNTV
ncbi:hypothetical protein EBR43_06330, partial [bacterium]|nr:hypothetical protein [bacterium]